MLPSPSPGNQLVASIPKGDMHPVNLPVSESVETLKLNLAGIIRPQKVVAGTHRWDTNQAKALSAGLSTL
jgi:hypothetical protein